MRLSLRVLLVSLLLWPAVSFASPNILVLITEMSSSGTSAWWMEDSVSIDSFHSRLVKAPLEGASWANIADPSVLSSVLRRANLSNSNALALASIAEAEYALVGTLGIESLPTFGAFDPQGVRAHLSAKLLKKSGAGVEEVADFTISTITYDGRRDDLVDALRDSLSLYFVEGPAAGGMESEEPVVILRGDLDGSALRWVEQQLMASPSVQGVRIAWAVPGGVALKVNPGRDDSSASVQKACQQLLVQNSEWRVQLASPEVRFGNALQFTVQKNTDPQ